MRTRTNTTATTAYLTMVGWEDDEGSRCSYDNYCCLSDDCYANFSGTVNFRQSQFPAVSGTYSQYGPYDGNVDDHQFLIGISWRYSGTTTSITPTCAQQSYGYSAGDIRSWFTYLTAGRTYRFSNCGVAEDTYLRLYGTNGYTVVAFNDDYCGSLSASQFDYVATTTGWHYVELSHYSRSALTTNGTLYYEDITPAPGNPSVFGNGTWNVYGYTGGNIDLSGEYSGYYTEPNLSYNSLNRWCSLCSPSDASGWSGCFVPVDNHLVMAKRTNFTCGIYQLSMPNNDDDVRVYVNGSLVASGVCCNTLTGVFWTGYLGSSSTIEVRHLEGGGGSNQSLTLTNITGSLSGGTIALSGYSTICLNDDPGSFTNSASASGGTVAYVTPTYQWQSSPNNSTWSDISGQTGTTYDPGTLSATTYFRRRVIDACGTVAYSNTVTITVNSPSGTPSVYGSNTWNIYAYNGLNFNTYYGYATNSTSSEFNLGTFGVGVASNPSVLPGYLGCALPSNDTWSISAKRQGFPCAVYNIIIQGHDDEIIINVDYDGNGTIDYTRTAACCNIATPYTVASGVVLNSTSRVEIQLKEGGGDAYVDVDFNTVAVSVSGGTIGGITTGATVCTGGDPGAFTKRSRLRAAQLLM